MKKLIKGELYRLKFSRCVPIRRTRSGMVSETSNVVYSGEYEFIGNRGSKYHFYNRNSGQDVLFSKAQLIEAFNNETK